MQRGERPWDSLSFLLSTLSLPLSLALLCSALRCDVCTVHPTAAAKRYNRPSSQFVDPSPSNGCLVFLSFFLLSTPLCCNHCPTRLVFPDDRPYVLGTLPCRLIPLSSSCNMACVQPARNLIPSVVPLSHTGPTHPPHCHLCAFIHACCCS